MNLIFNPRLQNRIKLLATELGFIAVLLACGGGAGGGGGVDTAKYTIGGTLNGLTAGQSVSVKDANSGQQVTLNTNGSYTVVINVVSGTTYSLSVSAQPVGQLCSLSNASGKVVASDISTVAINCANTLNLLAGNVGGSGNTDGLGANAFFANPNGVTTDGAGNIFVSDTNNHTIRKINLHGEVSTLAGSSGQSGSADGTGTLARFSFPRDLSTDNSGNLYVADTNNQTIRKISPQGIVSTFAGSVGQIGSADGVASSARFSFPYGLDTDSAGNLYVADTLNNTIRKINPQGVVSTLAGSAGQSSSADGTSSLARFNFPQGIATDSSGNVYVADTFNHTIRKISSQGIVSTLAGGVLQSGSTDGIGSLARLNFPFGLTTDSAGNVYVADTNNSTIRKISPLGLVSTIAGSPQKNGGTDGAGMLARFNSPQGIAIDGAGNLYVADTNNSTIRKINLQNEVSSFTLTAQSGSADGTSSLALFNNPLGIATDGTGNVFVADTFNHTIRMINPLGFVSTLAGSANQSGSADGNRAVARFDTPQGLATDNAGNVYVADTANHTIRKISPTGEVSTLAGSVGFRGSADGASSLARFNSPQGLSSDSTGNIYVTDTNNQIIRKISPQGVVSTLAGRAGFGGSADGASSLARFNFPIGLTTDSSGNIYVADGNNSTIRKINPLGVVSTIAGVALQSGSSDGPNTVARFSGPRGLSTDSAGNIYVADIGNHTIRKVNLIGEVSTVVGQAGSRGVALSVLPTSLARPSSVSLNNGKLFIITNNGVVWTYAP